MLASHFGHNGDDGANPTQRGAKTKLSRQDHMQQGLENG